jgi:hypothetical protein
MEIKDLSTTDKQYWKFHETHMEYVLALASADFYRKQVPYRGVKIVEERHEHMSIFQVWVLVNY